MVEKPSEPVWSIFTEEGAELQKYDIFPNLDVPEGGERTNTTNVAPGVKPESLVIDTDKKPAQLGRNGIARGDPSLVKSKDRTSPRPTGSFKVKEEDSSPESRENVQQSGSEKDRTSTRAEGRFMVKEENVSPGHREIVQLGGGEKVRPTPFEILPKEFRPSSSTSTLEEPGEAAAAALKYFERKRLESVRKCNFPVLDYQITLKKYYPEFVTKAENGIVGHVPGVEVGLTLRYRDELRLLGIHREKQKGIDSKDVLREDGFYYERVALSVVLSGVYEDCDDHGEVLIYVGEGGRDPKSNQQVKDQTKKSLGNEALKNNWHRKSPVRVIRKRTDASSPSKRLFSYDGLYMVADWEYITGMAGFKVYRFKLVREPNQNALVWQKRDAKPFVGHGTRQAAIAHGETKPFVGQVGRIASGKGNKPAIGQAARRGATASGEMEPQAARSEVTGRGESAVIELVIKGKQVSTSIKDDQVNFIDLSDEESVSSEPEDSSFIELSDNECVSDGMQSEDSEEKSVNIPDDFNNFDGDEGGDCIVRGEEGGDCIVQEELDEGGNVSPGCAKVGEESGSDVVEGKAGGPAAVQEIPLHVEGESPVLPSRLHGQPNVEEMESIEDGRKIEHADNIDTNARNDDRDKDGEYEVEKIMDKRRVGKRRQIKYLVRWKGYSESDDTWEPVSNLNNCRQLVENFDSSRKRRRLYRRG